MYQNWRYYKDSDGYHARDNGFTIKIPAVVLPPHLFKTPFKVKLTKQKDGNSRYLNSEEFEVYSKFEDQENGRYILPETDVVFIIPDFDHKDTITFTCEVVSYRPILYRTITRSPFNRRPTPPRSLRQAHRKAPYIMLVLIRPVVPESVKVSLHKFDQNGEIIPGEYVEVPRENIRVISGLDNMATIDFVGIEVKPEHIQSITATVKE